MKISCRRFYGNGKTAPFAFICFMEFDPFNKHVYTKLSNYIFTLSEYCRLGYANKLIEYINKNYQFSKFCFNDEYMNLF